MTISRHKLEIKTLLAESNNIFHSINCTFNTIIIACSPDPGDAVRGLAALVLLVPVLVAEVAGVGAGGELAVAGQDGEQQEGEQEAAHIL